MISPLLEAGVPFALATAAKATLLLGLAGSVHALARSRASAATRHLVWTLTIACLLLLPVLSPVLPGWGIPLPQLSRGPATVLAPAATPRAEPAAFPAREGRAAAPAPPAGTPPLRIPWASAALALYAAGVLLLLARLAVERLAIRRVAWSAQVVNEAEWTELVRSSARVLGVERPVALLRSRGATMPVTWGTRRPTILLPAAAGAWPEPRRRAVVLHEMAHVARHDCLVQTLAALACALYWLHPGVWWAARHLRVERELASDDLVVGAGTPPRDYAGHLLEIARTLHAPPAALTASMARPSQVEQRMLALLDTTRARASPGRRARATAALAAAALLVPVASARSLTADPAEQGEVTSDRAVAPHPLSEAPGRAGRGGSPAAARNDPPSASPGSSGSASERPVDPRLESSSDPGAARWPRSRPTGQERSGHDPDGELAVVVAQEGALRLALGADEITLRFTEAGLRGIEEDGGAGERSGDEPAAWSGSYSRAVALESIRSMRMSFPLEDVRDVEHRDGALVLLTRAADGERTLSGAMRGEVTVERVHPEQAERFVAAFRKAKSTR